ncbi:MAG: 50S ribosomal protein L14e [Hadesarchaea archaeon]|jgi:large subunit ribosomal protein L14e|nr:50S ribosomal protein L14e [Hadesarchaea archaeon]TDA33583.1 MAG: 50S ribosomal protein L14e [Hadesarchaea archaeon]
MEVGRVCVKVAGREAGRKCVVVEVRDDTYVVVVGKGVRRRRCNVKHLQPLSLKLDLPPGAGDEEVVRLLEEALSRQPEQGTGT